MNKNLLAVGIRSVLIKCFLLLAVITPFSLSAVTAQIKAPPRASQNEDIVISRDGRHNGQLAGCVGNVCTINRISIARSLIVWIGLKSNIQSILTPEDRLRDEVHYRDGSVHPGRLVGINTDDVVTERGRHPRAMVAWVYLTPRRQPENSPGQVGAPNRTPLPTPMPTPTRTPSPTPMPTPSSDLPSGPPPPGKRGGLWTGKITQRWIQRHLGGGALRITTTIDGVRLREYVQPISIVESGKLRQVGTITYLLPEGGRISEMLRDLNNVGGNGPGSYCTNTGEGTTRLIGNNISSSYIWKKNGSVDTTTGVGWNVPSGPGLYFIGMSIHTLGRYTVNGTCVNRDGTLVMKPEKGSFHKVTFGRIPSDPEPTDPELRFLDSTGSRMIGSYTNTRIIRGDVKLTVSWSICREGVTCAAPPSESGGASVSLGNLFETDLAELLAEAQLKLDGVLSKIKSDPNLIPEIRVIVKEGGDSIFLEVLAKVRIDVLKAWFAERGVDASQITWTWETGASDQVLFASE